MKAVESRRGTGEKPNREVNVKGKNKKRKIGGGGDRDRLWVDACAHACVRAWVLGVGRTELLESRD